MVQLQEWLWLPTSAPACHPLSLRSGSPPTLTLLSGKFQETWTFPWARCHASLLGNLSTLPCRGLIKLFLLPWALILSLLSWDLHPHLKCANVPQLPGKCEMIPVTFFLFVRWSLPVTKCVHLGWFKIPCPPLLHLPLPSANSNVFNFALFSVCREEVKMHICGHTLWTIILKLVVLKSSEIIEENIFT